MDLLLRASVPTAWRTIEAVAADDGDGIDALRAARARAMAWAWRRSGGPPLAEGMLVVDLDEIHVPAHSAALGAVGTTREGLGSARASSRNV
jgi:hypothetical protein